MKSIIDITLLAFLLGSLAGCSGSQMLAQNAGYNDNHQNAEYGLDKILKAVLAHQSTGDELETPTQSEHYLSQSFESQYKPYPSQEASSGNFYYPKSEDQNSSPKYISHQFDNSRRYQESNGYEYPIPIKWSNLELHQSEHSTNSGYQYNAPERYNYNKPSTSGYHYEKPSLSPHQSPSTYSNFKGYPYLPGPLTSNGGYEYGKGSNPEAVSQGQTDSGYHYESPKESSSGYWYRKPQESVRPESSFKGQLYQPMLPLPIFTDEERSSQGYSYEKPLSSFKGKPYLPLHSV